MRLKDTGLSAKELKAIVNKYMVETYERYDFIAERAEGMYIYDEEGNAYLDFYGGVAVNSAGNRNAKVEAAIKDQLGDIVHAFNYPYTIPQALLAKKICDTIGMDKIFYQNSGTEANECMIKMARKYGTDNLDRKDIISSQRKMVSTEELTEQCLQPVRQTMRFRWGSNRCFQDFLMQNITIWKILHPKLQKIQSRS